MPDLLECADLISKMLTYDESKRIKIDQVGAGLEQALQVIPIDLCSPYLLQIIEHEWVRKDVEKLRAKYASVEVE